MVMRHLTESHKKKIGEKTRIRNLTLGLKPPSNMGKKFSLEHRKKISLALQGRPHIGVKWTDERRNKMSKLLSGENCAAWRGGLTAKNKLIRGGLEYKMWREKVFKRDNWTCTFCNRKSTKGQSLEIHPDHIKPFAYFPDLRFEVSNGRTLCIDCHKLTDTYGNKARIKYEKGDHYIWQ